MKLNFSIIIPVYNRPNEIDELLESFTKQDFSDAYEIIIVEDGSDNSSEEIVNEYTSDLNIKYHYKENSGAGMSRNFGMEKATGIVSLSTSYVNTTVLAQSSISCLQDDMKESSV